MPLWASWLKDFDILNIFHDEFKFEKMAKFEILIATNGLTRSRGRNIIPGCCDHSSPAPPSKILIVLFYFISDTRQGPGASLQLDPDGPSSLSNSLD